LYVMTYELIKWWWWWWWCSSIFKTL